MLGEEWRDTDKREGYWRVEFSIPIPKIIDWFKKRRKKQAETEWAYDGCDCFPEEGYRSIPYCEKHFNKLHLREVA